MNSSFLKLISEKSNYLRPSTYYNQAKLKLGNTNTRYKQLVLMRDLRLWVLENAKFSNNRKHNAIGLEHINKEINYIHMKRSFRFCLFYVVGFYVVYSFKQNIKLKGKIDKNDYPVLLESTGGMAIFLPDGDRKYSADLKDKMFTSFIV